jgi:hypothetical protein
LGLSAVAVPFSDREVEMERTGIEPVTSGLQSRKRPKTAENGRGREVSDPAELCGFARHKARGQAEPRVDEIGSFWRFSGVLQVA